ncbi:MAG TPA: hypothetical protein VGG02_03595 [Chthoniobacterales bacterium]
MSKNLGKIVIALSALLAGIVFGRWVATPVTSITSAKTVAASPSPNESKAADDAAAASALEMKNERDRLGKRHSLADILKDHKSRNRVAELTDFVNKLGRGDFASALLSMRKFPRGGDRTMATQLVAARWAEVDPDGALAFAANHKDFGELTTDVFQQLASGDLQSALVRAQTLDDPTQRYEALRGALSVMAEQDPGGALQMAANFGNFPDQLPLSQVIYQQWSADDPAAAALAAAQDTSSTGWRSPLSQVIRNWASQDPQSALNYALTINNPGQEAQSIGQVVRQWGNQDPTAAAGWINSMPNGPARDAAAAALAADVSSSDLSAAVGWAESISDDGTRTSALQRMSQRVLWRDPTNGLATLQSAGVPATILQTVQSRSH